MKVFSLLVMTVAFAGISCERHEFEGPNGTKRLHEHHGPSHGDEADHGDHAGHGAEKETTEKAAH
jgi:hypothetical protein